MYFRPHDSGGLLVGGYSREPVTWDTDAPLAEPRTTVRARHGAVRRVVGGRAQPRAGAARRSSRPRWSTRPRPSPPTATSSWARPRSTACGPRPGSACTAWPAPAASARSWPSGSPTAGPSTTWPRWTSAASAPTTRQPSYARARALSAYSRYYDIVYPHQEFDAGRPLRLSPAYPRLAALDAAFGEKAGWERVNWFGANAGAGDESLRPRGWAGEFWSPAIGAECLAARDAAGAVRPVVVRQDRRARAGRGGCPVAAVRQRRGRRRRAARSTPSCSTTAAASRPT